MRKKPSSPSSSTISSNVELGSLERLVHKSSCPWISSASITPDQMDGSICLRLTFEMFGSGEKVKENKGERKVGGKM